VKVSRYHPIPVEEEIKHLYYIILYYIILYYTRWFKYDRDCLCVNLVTSVPVIFEPPCIIKAYSGFYGLNVLLTKLVTAVDCNTTLLPNET